MAASTVFILAATAVMIGLYIATLATKEYAVVNLRSDPTNSTASMKVKLYVSLQSKLYVDTTVMSATGVTNSASQETDTCSRTDTGKVLCSKLAHCVRPAPSSQSWPCHDFPRPCCLQTQVRHARGSTLRTASQSWP